MMDNPLLPVRQTPILDDRNAAEIYRAAIVLARQYCHTWSQYWPSDQPDYFDAADPGLTIFKLFADLSHHLIQQLNQVPGKYRLAFLDLMGVSPLAAQQAQAPLVFSPSHHAAVSVPQYTEVAVAGNAEVVFQTDEALTVLPTTIANAFSINPTKGVFVEHTHASLLSASKPFQLFGGEPEQPLQHMMVLVNDDFLNIQGPFTATLTLEGLNLDMDYFQQWAVSGADDFIVPDMHFDLHQRLAVNLNQSVCFAIAEQSLKALRLAGVPTDILEKLALIKGQTFIKQQVFLDKLIATIGASRTVQYKSLILQHAASVSDVPLTIQQTPLPPQLLQPKPPAVEKHFWIGVSPRPEALILDAPEVILPQLTAVDLEVEAFQVFPDHLLFNTTPLQSKQGFYPFGQAPKLDDAFYIQSDHIFSRSGASIKLVVQDLRQVIEKATAKNLTLSELMDQAYIRTPFANIVTT